MKNQVVRPWGKKVMKKNSFSSLCPKQRGFKYRNKPNNTEGNSFLVTVHNQERLAAKVGQMGWSAGVSFCLPVGL